jgi:hypothetical protein
MRRIHSRTYTSIIASALIAALGCGGGAVRQAAREAAPAALEGAADEAQDPKTRDNLAQVLGDEGIQAAMSELSRAVVSGAVAGLSDAERTAQMEQAVDGLVRQMGAAFGRSLQRDIAPQLSGAVSTMVAQSLERALNARTEERLEAIARSMTRGAMTGLGEAMFDPMTGRPAPALRLAAGQLARELTHQAAFGFQDAVWDAEAGNLADTEPALLASVGKVSRLALALPALLVAGVIAGTAIGLAVLVWALLRLRHYRRLNRAHEDAALALARAIKSAEDAAWSDELRQHIARATRGGAGREELEQLLREHAELRLRPRPPAPDSARSATLG